VEEEEVQKVVEGNKFGMIGRGHISADDQGNTILTSLD
jgi:hypothetical protein